MSGLTIAKERRPLAMYEYSDNGQQIVVKIMQPGDKYSVTEKPAEEWLAQISERARQGNYDPTWVAQFKLEYEEFQKGNELPRDGTPIRTWGMISREQGTRLITLNITTVEDLAAIPDSAVGQLGLDGRVLRDTAKNYIASQSGAGEALAKRAADLEQSNRDMKETIERMAQKMAELEAQLPKGKKAA